MLSVTFACIRSQRFRQIRFLRLRTKRISEHVKVNRRPRLPPVSAKIDFQSRLTGPRKRVPRYTANIRIQLFHLYTRNGHKPQSFESVSSITFVVIYRTSVAHIFNMFLNLDNCPCFQFNINLTKTYVDRTFKCISVNNNKLKYTPHVDVRRLKYGECLFWVFSSALTRQLFSKL